MLVFITSIRHPLNCYSFDRVLRLLDITLNSIFSQKDSNFEVVIVSNQGSISDLKYRVHNVEVDFPPPSLEESPKTGMSAIQIDRGSKYAIGLKYAEKLNPSHIIFFDADDLVDNRLSGLVKTNPDSNGWYFDEGYSYRLGSKKLNSVSDFYKHCGTSYIINYDEFENTKMLNLTNSQEEIIDLVGLNYVKVELGSHRLRKRWSEKRGRSLSPLPFPGAVWVLGHGENHSGRAGDEGTLPITEELKNQFAFPDDVIVEQIVNES